MSPSLSETFQINAANQPPVLVLQELWQVPPQRSVISDPQVCSGQNEWGSRGVIQFSLETEADVENDCDSAEE